MMLKTLECTVFFLFFITIYYVILLQELKFFLNRIQIQDQDFPNSYPDPDLIPVPSVLYCRIKN